MEKPNWSEIDSVYYVFVTLTTIGFGDYLPAQNRLSPTTFAQAMVTLAYLMFILFWVLSGLVQLNFMLTYMAEIIDDLYEESESLLHFGRNSKSRKTRTRKNSLDYLRRATRRQSKCMNPPIMVRTFKDCDQNHTGRRVEISALSDDGITI